MLITRGTHLAFCWIPSHCSFYHNEKVDMAAKRGAKQRFDSEQFDFPLALHEMCNLITSHVWKTFKESIKVRNNKEQFDIKTIKQNFSVNKKLLSTMYRWKLNAFKTKYVRNILCICGSKITPEHIVICNDMIKVIPVLKHHNVEAIFQIPALTYDFFFK